MTIENKVYWPIRTQIVVCEKCGTCTVDGDVGLRPKKHGCGGKLFDALIDVQIKDGLVEVSGVDYETGQPLPR